MRYCILDKTANKSLMECTWKKCCLWCFDVDRYTESTHFQHFLFNGSIFLNCSDKGEHFTLNDIAVVSLKVLL